jgi:hypothetical protein
MTADRKTMLNKLVVGDIFQADGPNGAQPPCLIYDVTATIIKARAVTTQAHFDFDRETGIGKWKDGSPVTITSIAPLPVEIHNIVLSLDRKNRLLLELKDAALTDDEITALLFLSDHHESNQM